MSVVTAEKMAPRLAPVMLYVGGSKVSFHCNGCGSNVFHHPPEKPSAYECNGCGHWYVETPQ